MTKINLFPLLFEFINIGMSYADFWEEDIRS
jgi:hypothetical protein